MSKQHGLRGFRRREEIQELKGLVTSPSLHLAWLRYFMLKTGLGSYGLRLRLEAVPRPSYGFCMYYAALEAKMLGYRRIAGLEFGVDKGNGLTKMEWHAREIERVTGVQYEIYGFDTGKGLPPPASAYDLPYEWSEGFFAMDINEVKKELKTAKLVIGDIKDTAPQFLNKCDVPIACAMFDLDYHSSTVSALKVFEGDASHYLPRVYCYFDDIIGNGLNPVNDEVGQTRAILEFNRSHNTKVSKISGLSSMMNSTWNEQIYIFQDFAHPQYAVSRHGKRAQWTGEQ